MSEERNDKECRKIYNISMNILDNLIPQMQTICKAKIVNLKVVEACSEILVLCIAWMCKNHLNFSNNEEIATDFYDKILENFNKIDVLIKEAEKLNE